MKHIIKTGLVIWLLAGGVQAERLVLDETFGLPEKVEVLSCDGANVKVKTGAGISIRSFGSFPDFAQEEILAWGADETFRSSSKLRVKIEEGISELETSHGEIHFVKYEVEAENRGDVALTNVEAVCSIFYEKIESGVPEKKYKAVSSLKICLHPEKPTVIKSKTVELRDEIIPGKAGVNPYDQGASVGSASTYYEDVLNGVLICLYRKNRHGEMDVREFKDGRLPKKKDRDKYKSDAVSVTQIIPSYAR